MTTKHTPGPWEVEGVEIRASNEHPSESLCVMTPGFNEADAVLMASAPKLLAALVALEEAARQVMSGEMAVSSIQIERMAAQDVIAEATGKLRSEKPQTWFDRIKSRS